MLNYIHTVIMIMIVPYSIPAWSRDININIATTMINIAIIEFNNNHDYPHQTYKERMV